MSSIYEMFPSSSLFKALDIAEGRPLALVVKKVEQRELKSRDGGGDKPKPVMLFENDARGLALNKTNAGTLAEAWGEDYNRWAGRTVYLKRVMVDFQGKRTPGIRVDVQRQDLTPPVAAPGRPAAAGAAAAVQRRPDSLDTAWAAFLAKVATHEKRGGAPYDEGRKVAVFWGVVDAILPAAAGQPEASYTPVQWALVSQAFAERFDAEDATLQPL